jgi:phage gpG-like protein
MTRMTPSQMLRSTQALLSNMEEAKSKAVFVGLPKEKVGGEIYGEGRTIIENGAVHEHGSLDGDIPARSFLKMPFTEKKADMGGAILQQFTAVAEGRRSVDEALGRVGIAAINIVKAAFRTGGFGKWKPLAQSTIDRKGHSKILEDTRVLRNSQTWVVRAE